MEKENNKAEIYLNYKRNNKWLGLIDYKSLIFICVYIFLIVSILKFIPIKLEYLIYVFIFLVVPVIAIIVINVGDDSAIDTLMIIFKYCLNNKIYVKKEYVKNLSKEVYKKIKID